MSHETLVSVIIPAYNSENFVSRAISSVLSQTHKNIECLVIDDGSTDNTAAAIEKFEGNVNYHYQENAGAAAARNKGIEIAQGEFVAFLDSDDYWVSTKIENQLEVFKLHPELALVCAASGFHTDDETAIKHIQSNIPLKPQCLNIYKDFASLFKAPYIGLPSVIVRTQVLREVDGFSNDLETAEDLDLYFRICWHHKAARIEQKLTYLHALESSLGNRMRSYSDNLLVIDRLLTRHPEFEIDHGELICSVRLSIYKKWIKNLLYFGFGKQARKVLRQSKKIGDIDEYNQLMLKSYFSNIVVKLKGRRYTE